MIAALCSVMLIAQLVTSGGVQASTAATSPQSSGAWAWGDNRYGQLGDGTTVDRQSPVSVAGMGSALSMAAGSSHSLAVSKDGSVWAWGSNSHGELGDGTTTEHHTPVRVSGLSGITAAAAGVGVSLALRSDSTVWAWGANFNCQLGDGTSTDRLVPIQVEGLSGVTSVAAGYLRSFAVRADGTVWEWGLGDYSFARCTPAQLPGLSRISAVAAGAGHNLALRYDGSVWAWGRNNRGQLGDGTVSDSLVPHQVPGLTEVTAIAAGFEHSLAVRSDGTVWAWGDNRFGQLGNGNTTEQHSPAVVSDLSGVIGITAGDAWGLSLALRSDGTVWAWGDNSRGELGDGSTTERLTPVQVSGLSGVSNVSAGGLNALAVGSAPDPDPPSTAPVSVDLATGAIAFTRPVYVALGDSVASGHGLRPYMADQPGRDSPQADLGSCKRSNRAYPFSVGAKLNSQGYIAPWSARRFNWACSGNNTAKIRTQAQQAATVIKGYTTIPDTKGTNSQAQVAYATITAGADDFDFTSAATAQHLFCDGVGDFRSWVDSVLAGISGNLLGTAPTIPNSVTQPRFDRTTVLGSLADAGATAIVVTGYYNPIGGSDDPIVLLWTATQTCDPLPLPGDQVAAQRLASDAARAAARAAYVIDQLDRRLQSLVASANQSDILHTSSYDRFRFVQFNDAFAGGMNCYSGFSYVQRAPSRQTFSKDGDDCIHPSQAGSDLIAAIVTNSFFHALDDYRHVVGSPSPAA